MSNRFDFDLVIGDSYPPPPLDSVTVRLDTGPKDGADYVAIPLTGASIEAKATLRERDLADAGVASVVAFEVALLNQVTDEGAFTWSIPETESVNLVPARYSYRITVVGSGGSRVTVLQGQIRAHAGVR